MLPVYDSRTFRQLEAEAIASGLVTALDLMEQAGHYCAQRILYHTERVPGLHFLILAGQGNNGGDGLVIARYLAQAGKQVRVVVVEHGVRPTEAYRKNRDSLGSFSIPVITIDSTAYSINVGENELVVDCLFGSGLSRPLVGWLAQVIDQVLASNRPLISVDRPSGVLDPDLGVQGAAFQADRTLVLGALQSALFVPETGPAYGNWELIPIGLPLVELPPTRWVEEQDVRDSLRVKPRFSHKGNYGHALILAGGPGCHGAALLAAKGCVRSGAGLITLAGTKETLLPVMMALPDVMTVESNDLNKIILSADIKRYTCLLLGPGLGNSQATAAAVEQALRLGSGPVVLDADALNVIADQRELLELLGPSVVLTPHPKEMDRLLGMSPPTAMDRLHRTQVFAARYRCTVILKGAYSAVCVADGRTFYTPTGNAGMAKGGSGDVLAGLLAGVLAQGYDTLNASILSLFIHGSAGDLAAAAIGQDAMRASDLVEHLPAAWLQLRPSGIARLV